MKTIKLIFVLMVFSINYVQAQQKENPTTSTNNVTMKTYIIERVIPGAGNLTPDQLKGVSQTSCAVLNEMGPKIEWLQSYVTGDKIYCVYKAENKELIEEHAKKGGFPANTITEVVTTISPETTKN